MVIIYVGFKNCQEPLESIFKRSLKGMDIKDLVEIVILRYNHLQNGVLLGNRGGLVNGYNHCPQFFFKMSVV